MEMGSKQPYVELMNLPNFAAATAGAWNEAGRTRPRKYARRLRRAVRSLGAAAASAEGEGGAWLRENLGLLTRRGLEAARAIYDCGPIAVSGRGAPCLELCCQALVASGLGEVSPERLRVFLRSFQKTRPLCERELWLVPEMLTGELIFHILQCPENAEAAVRSVQLLSAEDLTETLEGLSALEEALRQDPAGLYPLMDRGTREQYRRRITRIAEGEGVSELRKARDCLSLAQRGPERHVGHYIFAGDRKKPPLGLYVGAVTVGSLFLAVLAGFLLENPLAAFLLLLPIWEAVKSGTDFLVCRLTPPRRLMRMDFSRGIPRAGRTICVISAVLSSEKGAEELFSSLEKYMLTNRSAGENLLFGVLGDLGEATSPSAEGDEGIIRTAAGCCRSLNERWGGGFYLFLRPRTYHAADKVYRPRERKRGALEELAALLSGEESPMRAAAGDPEGLRGVNFILTLDADTRLTADSAAKLVGAALHPLNRPVLDRTGRRVLSGFGIISPRVGVDLEAAGRSDFSRIFAGIGGAEPYGLLCSEALWDLYGAGLFTGKGLINVPVYRQVMRDAVPEGIMLSHDIIEGACLGVGFLSDAELTDGFPCKVKSYLARLDRWTRGDWQNAPWLGSRRISPLDQWRLFENLRRSLTPASELSAILLGIFWPGAWLAAVWAVLLHMSSLIARCVFALLKHDGTASLRTSSPFLWGIPEALIQGAVGLLLLPAKAYVTLRAAVTALWRMKVTGKGLLAWVTSGQAEQKSVNTLASKDRA
ncbi:MAG: hypothetical protein II794_02730 [Oscillospiraceae bacterium]|nr:hypothetical protein [Oscillospiraceae bacterium]